MNEYIKKIIGYGFIPSNLLIFILYLYYILLKYQYLILNNFLVELFIYIFVSIIIIKIFNIEGIIYYLGYNKIETYKWFLIFTVNYLCELLVILIINKNFFSIIPHYLLFVSPIVLFIIMVFIKQTFEIKVVFMKIIPNLYIDMVFFRLHTREEINSYDITPIFQEELHVESLLFACSVLERTKLKNVNSSYRIDIEENYFSKNKLYILLYENEDNLIWKEQFTFTKEENNEENISKIKEYILIFENYKRQQTKYLP